MVSWVPRLPVNNFFSNVSKMEEFESFNKSHSNGKIYKSTLKIQSWVCAEPLRMFLVASEHPSCPTLWDLIDSSPPGSSIPGILQARILEWVAIFFSNAWKWKVPGASTRKGVRQKSKSEVAQSSPTLREPMDCSLPDSSIHGIFQARVLEWVATAFSEWA